MKVLKKSISLMTAMLLLMSSIGSSAIAAGGDNGGSPQDVTFNIVRFQSKEVVVYDWDLDAEVYEESENYYLGYKAERRVVEDRLEILIGVETDISFIRSMTAQLIAKDSESDGSGGSSDGESGDGISSTTSSALVLCTHDVDFYNMTDDGLAEFFFVCEHSEHFDEATHFQLNVEYEVTRGSTKVIETMSDSRPIEIENHESYGYTQIQVEEASGGLDTYLRGMWLDDIGEGPLGLEDPIVLVTLEPGDVEEEEEDNSKTTDNPIKDDTDIDPLEASDYPVDFNVLAGSHVHRGVKDLGTLEIPDPDPEAEEGAVISFLEEAMTLVAYEYSEQDDDYNLGSEVLASIRVPMNGDDPVEEPIDDPVATEDTIARMDISRNEYVEVEAAFADYYWDELTSQYIALETLTEEELEALEALGDDISYYVIKEVVLFQAFDVTTGASLRVGVPELDGFNVLGVDLPPEVTEDWYIDGITSDGADLTFGVYTPTSDSTGDITLATMTVYAGSEEYTIYFYEDAAIDTSLLYLFFSDDWEDQFGFMDPLGGPMSEALKFDPLTHSYIVTIDVPTELPNGALGVDILEFQEDGVTPNPDYLAYQDAEDAIESFIANDIVYPTLHQLNVKAVNELAELVVLGRNAEGEDFGVPEAGMTYSEYQITVSVDNVPDEVYTVKIAFEVQDATVNSIKFDNEAGTDLDGDGVADGNPELNNFDRYTYDYTVNTKFFSDYAIDYESVVRKDEDGNIIGYERAVWDKVLLDVYGIGVVSRTQYFSAKLENDTAKFTVTSPEHEITVDGEAIIIPAATRIYTLRISEGGSMPSASSQMLIGNFELMKSSTKVNFVHTEELMSPSIEIYDVSGMVSVDEDNITDLHAVKTFGAGDFKVNFGNGKHQQYITDDSTEIFYYQMNFKGRENTDLDMGKTYALAVLDGGEVLHFNDGSAAVVNFTVGEDLERNATDRDDTRKLLKQ